MDFENQGEDTDLDLDLDLDIGDVILGGAFGHPYSGRPGGLSEEDIKNYEENMTFIEWLFNPDRKLYKRPKTLIGKIFSLGDNSQFDDKVSEYHKKLAQEAIENAKGLIGKDKNVDIVLGDINGDGIADKIIGGINKAIDLTGDGKADAIGTLIDTTGDGKADFILDTLGNLTKIDGDIANIIGDSKLTLDDLKAIPEIISALLGK